MDQDIPPVQPILKEDKNTDTPISNKRVAAAAKAREAKKRKHEAESKSSNIPSRTNEPIFVSPSSTISERTSQLEDENKKLVKLNNEEVHRFMNRQEQMISESRKQIKMLEHLLDSQRRYAIKRKKQRHPQPTQSEMTSSPVPPRAHRLYKH